ncbi:MAG: hypothetical protein Ct9H300mP9_6300 [Candidatus Neomarinimicrobiota bacterium]|nr:MAG: hypothetical protein Ct9H300mP9_6300 [Candidatus Neomarinimicrobiota bacterium]
MVYPFVAIAIVSGRVMQGLGKGIPVLVITTIRVLGVSAPLALYFSFVLDVHRQHLSGIGSYDDLYKYRVRDRRDWVRMEMNKLNKLEDLWCESSSRFKNKIQTERIERVGIRFKKY